MATNSLNNEIEALNQPLDQLEIHNEEQAGAQIHRAPSCATRRANSNSQSDRRSNSGTYNIVQSLDNTDRLEIQRLKTARQKVWNGLGRKDGVKIASLNMRGRRDARKREKWPLISTMIRKHNILVLAVQEAHLNKEETDKLTDKNPKIIVHSSGNHTSKEGVAFVINKDKLRCRYVVEELIPGRAMRLQLQFDDDNGLDIINVYCPNNLNEKVAFINELSEKLRTLELTEPIIMGDFNFVESELDRYPMRGDDKKLTEAFEKITKKYKLKDGWRIHNPIEKAYTLYMKNDGAMARIDRIYMNQELTTYAYNWGMLNSLNMSDHDCVTVEILKKKLPYIGKGLARLDASTIDSPTFRKKIAKKMKEAQDKMQNSYTDNKDDVQETWMKLKEEIMDIAQKERKEKRAQLEREEKKLNKKIKKNLEKLAERVGESAKKVEQRIKELREELSEKKRDETIKLQQKTKARFNKLGERCTKYWFNLQKPKRTGTVVLALIDSATNRLTTETRKMKEIALEYHGKLQERPEMNDEREQAIKQMEEITVRKLSEEQIAMLTNGITKEEISQALSAAANGTSPGIDGIPIEFYKSWETPKTEEEKENMPDMVEILYTLYRDIERRGVSKRQQNEEGRQKQFTDGVMSILYKKKEKWRIENYRPITLLNNDYKIYTKTIAVKLGQVAATLLHENQAGFVPKRNLYDSTKLTHSIIEYCELNGTNGCILALDQEKAYDKIDHDYMWRILQKNGFPEPFLNRVKEMYKDTEKAILVNADLSDQYKVKRGVHQGDPMSCLLYNFAIEPLAESIRQSELKGIEIDGAKERVIVSLFADDTLVYLRKEDDFNKLKEIIDTFCRASTAKFNIEKTEYLPIGDQEYRNEVQRTRKVGNNQIDDNLTLIKEGEVMRTLGAWVGNGNKVIPQWEKILATQEKIINNCKTMHLSFKGKELVLKALIQSRAVFLAMVNGMPKEVEKKMNKMYHDLMWDGKKSGLMAWDKAIKSKAEGGLNIPDLKSRLEAIELMWVKKWLGPTINRPVWAFVIDQIIFKNIKSVPKVEDNAKMSWLLQNWHESTANNSKISPQIRRMLNVARQYDITIHAPKLSKETKRQLPVWLHHFGEANNNYTVNKKAAKCLRDKHKVRTIGDLDDLESELEDHPRCALMKRTIMEGLPEIMKTVNQTPQRVRTKNLDFTPRRIERRRRGDKVEQFNPDVTAKGEPVEETRLFAENRGVKKRNIQLRASNPAYKIDSRKERANSDDEPDELTEDDYNSELDFGRRTRRIKKTPVRRKMRRGQNGEIVAVIHASAVKPQYENGKLAFAIYYNGFHARNKQIIPVGQNKTLLRGTILAAIEVLEDNKGEDVIIRTVSRTLYKMMTGGSEKQENAGWANNPLKNEWEALLRIARARNNKVEFYLIEKETEFSKDAETARIHANGAARHPEEAQTKEINLREDLKDFNYQGVRLTTLTQRLAYEFTKNKNAKDPITQTTQSNLNLIKDEIQRLTDLRPREEDIWKGLKPMEPFRMADFFWKMIHGKIKCGSYFRHMPTWADKQFCPCGEIEDIDHIILTCKESGIAQLWEEVSEIWSKITETPFIMPTKGVLLGITVMVIQNEKKTKIDDQNTWLYRTLVETTAWAIWRTRNDRIFAEIKPSAAKHIAKWKTELRNRIQTEFLGIELEPYQKRAASYEKLKKKWCMNKVIASLKYREKEWILKIYV